MATLLPMLVKPALKFGWSQAKKQKKKRDLRKQHEQFQEAGVYPPYPPDEPYPLGGYPKGAVPGTTMDFPPPEQTKTSRPKSIIFSILRFLQFVFGLTVIGLYGRDVRHDHKNNISRSQWVYALVVGALATTTALVRLVKPFVSKKLGTNASPGMTLLLPQLVWELILCVLWLALFGVFAKLYIGVYPKADDDDASKINRMRHGVWVDLVNLGFWVASALWIAVRWYKSKRTSAIDVEKEIEA